MAAKIEIEQNSGQQLVLISQSPHTDEDKQMLMRLDPEMKECTDPEEFEQFIKQSKNNQTIVLIVDETLHENVRRWLDDFGTIDSVYLVQKKDSTGEEKFEHAKVRFQSQSLVEISKKIAGDGFRSNISMQILSRLDISEVDSNIYLIKILFCLCASVNNDQTTIEAMSINLSQHAPANTTLQHALSCFYNNYNPENPAYWLFEEAFTEIYNDMFTCPIPGAFLVFRPFLHDLWKQFGAQKCDGPQRFYVVRYLNSQSMDFWNKQKVGDIVATRSFIVAKTDPEAANAELAGKQHPNSHNILLEIEADPSVMKSSMFILNPDRNEAVLMCGTFLQLVGNRTDSDNVLRVSVRVCGDDVHELNAHYSGLMPQYDSNEQTISIRDYLSACYQIGDSINNSQWMRDVEMIIKQFMKALNGEDSSMTDFLDILGWIKMKQSRWEECIELNLQSIKIKSRIPDSEGLLVENYLVLADAYLVQKQYDDGIECVHKLISIFEKWNALDCRWRSELNMKLGRLFRLKGEHQRALMYLYDALKSVPALNSNGETWASCSILYGDLGRVHYALGDYRIAIGYYKQAIKIRGGQGIIGDKLVGEYYRLVGLAYGKAQCVEESRQFLNAAKSSFDKAGMSKKSDEVSQDINALDSRRSV